LEAVLEVTDQKQSKTDVESVKGNRLYAQKKRDKVDGESVRNDILATYTVMCEDPINQSSGEKSAPKKQLKSSITDGIAGMQDLADKKHEETQQKLAIASKKLEFAEKKEERRSKNMEERFVLQHRRIDVQQQQQQQQQQYQSAQLQQVITQQQSSEAFNKMVVENQRLMMEIIAKTMGTASSASTGT
jgi:hypothetical protein